MVRVDGKCSLPNSSFGGNNQMLRKGIDELFATVQEYASSDKFRELLNFTAHFKKYAHYNAMLIHIQNLGARFVLPAAPLVCPLWIRSYS